MKRTSLILLFAGLVTFSIPSLIAQATQDGVHAPSGGTRLQIVSIDVPPLAGAPFTATVSTTVVRTLDGGSTITYKNHRTIARDNLGRIYQERRHFAPEGSPGENGLRQIEISDPRTRVIYYCHPDEHTCDTHNYFPRTSPAQVIPAGPINGGSAFLTRTLLGNDTMSGVEVTGTRETTTFNAGAIGNDQAFSVVKEFWYSAQLGINVTEKRQDPRVGTETFVVDQITLGEPDASLFEMPAGFRVVDLRNKNDAAGGPVGNN